MKKIFIVLLLAVSTLSLGTLAVANEAELRRLAARVDQLVQERSHRLNYSEQLELREHLQSALAVFREGRPTPPPPSRDYSATTELGPLSRKSGGELMYSVFRTPVELSSIRVTPRGSQVRIHSATLVSDNNVTYRIDELERAGLLRDRQSLQTSLLHYPNIRVREIRLRLEAWSTSTTLEIEVLSPDRSVRFDDGRGGYPTPTPPPATHGHYCSAACADNNNRPDFRYSRGALANFEIEAQQQAVESVRGSFSCARGIVSGGCSPVWPYTNFASIAACADNNGRADLRYARTAEGSALEEARQLSRQKVAQTLSCARGIVIYKAGNDVMGPHYCIAACADNNGRADLRYSKGESGPSEVHAMGKAISAIANSYSCARGIVIDRCSR